MKIQTGRLEQSESTLMSALSPMLAVRRIRGGSLLHDLAELTKVRVASLIVMTAWCGYFFASRKAGLPHLNWGLFHASLGIGLVSSGTAALNEVMEREVDGQMRRTASRPLPAGRMSLWHASVYFRGCVSGSDAWGPGMDSRAGTHRVGNLHLVRDFVPLAISPLFFDCLAVPGGLRPRRRPHAAGGGTAR
jgi:hypothetical protein